MSFPGPSCLLAALVVLLFSLDGQAAEPTQRIKPDRAGIATVKGSVVRGERSIYLLTAAKGQELQLSIESEEANAVFSVIAPKSKAAMPGAAEGDDTTKWSATLPKDGDYQIVVGGTRGNATFKLKVSLKPKA